MRADSTESEPPLDLPLRAREPEPAAEAPSPLGGTVLAAGTPREGRGAMAAGMLVIGLLAGFGAGFLAGQRLAVPEPPRAVEVPRPAPIETVPPVQLALPPPVAPAQHVPEAVVVDAPVVIDEPEVKPPASVPAKPAAARPRIRPATVRFDSKPPGATVYVDEVRVGVTPLTLTTVAPGTHQVRFEMFGHDTWRTSMTAEAGGQHVVGASLE